MRRTSLLLVVALLTPSTLAFAQTASKPAPATAAHEAVRAPSTTKKPAPTAKPAAPATTAKPAPAAKPEPPPPPPPPSDLRFKSRYTTGDQVTESVTYVSGARERYEARQHDPAPAARSEALGPDQR